MIPQERGTYDATFHWQVHLITILIYHLMNFHLQQQQHTSMTSNPPSGTRPSKGPGGGIRQIYGRRRTANPHLNSMHNAVMVAWSESVATTRGYFIRINVLNLWL